MYLNASFRTHPVANSVPVSYLLAYLLNFTTPMYLGNGRADWLEKNSACGGSHCMPRPWSRSKSEWGKGVFPAPQNYKVIFFGIFFSETCLNFLMILILVVNKNQLVLVEFYDQNLFQDFREKNCQKVENIVFSINANSSWDRPNITV
jgi:hypothetical protein